MFEAGQRVRTRERETQGHTRLPGYLQRRDGRVVSVLGEFRFADEGARCGAQARKEMLYTVEFEDAGHRIRADLFKSYLESQA